MDLIERYLDQVGRRLPADRRADVTTELRSALFDALEVRTASGEDAGSAAVDLLREYGPPDLLAASFDERRRFLIGPELYPAFVKVFGIAVVAVSSLLVFSALVAWLRDRSTDLASVAGGLGGNLVQTAVAVLGWVVLVFWIVERSGGRSATGAGRPWDPSELPPVNDPERVSRGGLAVGLFFLSAFLLVLNVFPDKIVALVEFDGSTTAMPLVGPGLRANTWLITLVLGGLLVVRLAVLARGRWSSTLRWIDLGLDFLWIGVLVRLIRTDRLLAADPATAIRAGWTAEKVVAYTGRVVPILETLLKVALAAAVVGCLVALVAGVYRQLKRSSGSVLFTPETE